MSSLASRWLLLAPLLAAPGLAQVNSCLQTCLESSKVPSYFSTDGSEWSNLTISYNQRLPYTPAAVVTAASASDVSQAVKCAQSCNGIKVQARSGGHSFAAFGLGGQDGSLVIDLALLNEVTVNSDDTADVGGGVRLGNVDEGLWNQGQRAMSHGTCADVGIGGHITHGGYGFESRMWGLALDHILEVEVVLPNGTITTASATENEDLYWAVRGAADSIGIVTKFHLRTQAAPESVVYWVYDLSDILADVPTSVAALQHIQDFALNATVQDRRLGWGWLLDSWTFQLRGKFFGSLDEFNSKIATELLRGLPAPRSADVRQVSWLESQALYYDSSTNVAALAQPDQPGEYQTQVNFYAKSVTVPEPLTADAMTSYFTYAANQNTGLQGDSYWCSIVDLYGGPDSQISIYDAAWSSYKDRDTIWVVQNYGSDNNGSPFDTGLFSFLQGMNDAMTEKMPNTDFGAYANYIDPELTAQQAHQLYYGPEIYPRLLDIKKSVDPNQLFYNPLAIGVGDY